MKKVIYFIFVFSLALVGCNKSKNELTMLIPTGAPSLAFYNYISDENVETNNVPTNILGAMTKQDYDIIVIDIISGINMINKGAKYKLDAMITFGNYFILNLGNDDDNLLEDEDIIVSWAKDLTPDLIYKSVLPNISPSFYVNSVNELAPIAMSGKFNMDNEIVDVDYVYIAQPAMQNVLNNNLSASIYANIQELFSEKFDIIGIPQAGIFISESALSNKSEEITNFSNQLKTNINSLINNSDILGNLTNYENKFGVAVNVAKTVISNGNQLGLGYKKALEYKNDINKFFEILQIDEINEQFINK